MKNQLLSRGAKSLLIGALAVAGGCKLETSIDVSKLKSKKSSHSVPTRVVREQVYDPQTGEYREYVSEHEDGSVERYVPERNLDWRETQRVPGARKVYVEPQVPTPAPTPAPAPYAPQPPTEVFTFSKWKDHNDNHEIDPFECHGMKDTFTTDEDVTFAAVVRGSPGSRLDFVLQDERGRVLQRDSVRVDRPSFMRRVMYDDDDLKPGTYIGNWSLNGALIGESRVYIVKD